MKPLAIDLFCGLGGWTEGLLAEGYRVVGFDNERHVYSEAKYPAELVLQDVLTLHGAQFKDAALIVASPPCQAYSYRAMPWKKAKALPPPDNTLFEACFRIQREACEAAGHHIPLVVENVCGAQKWVGRARWHYGSFYLWGDVPALMPIVMKRHMKSAIVSVRHLGCTNFHQSQERRATKNNGGSCIHGVHWSAAECRDCEGAKRLRSANRDPGARFTSQDCGLEAAGIKQHGIGGMRKNGKGDAWFENGAAEHGSKSNARKAASAHIAKIPYELARHIARAWNP